MLQRARNIAGRVPCRFSERGRERSIRDDRANARNDDGDGGRQVRRQLAEPRRRTRILDFRSRRCARRLRERTLLVVRARDDGDALAWNSERAQIFRRRGRGGRLVKERHHQSVCHQSVV